MSSRTSILPVTAAEIRGDAEFLEAVDALLDFGCKGVDLYRLAVEEGCDHALFRKGREPKQKEF